MQEARDFADRMEAEQGATKFTQLRDELLRGKDVRDDSIPSG